MRHGSPFAQARSPLVPLCAAPCVCATAPGGKPSGHRGDVGPEGRPPFVGHIFRACAKPGTGPDLRPSRHASQHTMPESGALPGAPAGPGPFSVSAEKFGCFPPSFGTPSEFLIRGPSNDLGRALTADIGAESPNSSVDACRELHKLGISPTSFQTSADGNPWVRATAERCSLLRLCVFDSRDMLR